MDCPCMVRSTVTDAYAFLLLQGGLTATPKSLRSEEGDDDINLPQVHIYRVPKQNQYGEPGKRIAGVQVVDGEDAILEQVPTRLTRWELVPNLKARQKRAASETSRKTYLLALPV